MDRNRLWNQADLSCILLTILYICSHHFTTLSLSLLLCKMGTVVPFCKNAVSQVPMRGPGTFRC